MAMLRSCRGIISRLAGACSARSSVGILSAPVVIGDDIHFHSSCSPSPGAATVPSLRCLLSLPVSSSAGMALIPAPVVFKIPSRSYAKRPKKWQGGPYALVQVESGVPVPPYRPNDGSVKNRKHKKRMAQRDAFAKEQAQRRKAETKAAVMARDTARRKRWRDGAARARAWAREQARVASELQAKTVPA